MGQTKVRCQYCGAKNTDETTERCRICSGLFPDAAERRKRTIEGETFMTLVENEVDTWRLYTESRFEAEGMSDPSALQREFATDGTSQANEQASKRSLRRLFRS